VAAQLAASQEGLSSMSEDDDKIQLGVEMVVKEMVEGVRIRTTFIWLKIWTSGRLL
jgi:hypothetical protein